MALVTTWLPFFTYRQPIYTVIAAIGSGSIKPSAYIAQAVCSEAEMIARPKNMCAMGPS